jgi:hypothetical protein
VAESKKTQRTSFRERRRIKSAEIRSTGYISVQLRGDTVSSFPRCLIEPPPESSPRCKPAYADSSRPV